MKRVFFALLAGMLFFYGCQDSKKADAAAPQTVIFETDLGNDVDDAMALDLFFKYMDEGKINLAAIMLNKEGDFSAEYADILCTWYGHPEVQIGIIRDGADCATDAVQPVRVRATPTFRWRSTCTARSSQRRPTRVS